MTVVPVMVVGGVVAGSGPAVPRDGGDRVLVALDAALRLHEEVVDGKEERCPVEGEGEERYSSRAAHRSRSYPWGEPAGEEIPYTPLP